MSKSATSDEPSPVRWANAAWRLCGGLWVGGLWLLQFLVLPGLQRMGLAPLLVEEAQTALRSSLIAFVGFCVLLQVLLLRLAGRGLLSDDRGRLLLATLLLILLYLVAPLSGALQAYLQLFAYLAMAFAGLLLLVGPAPREVSRVRG